MAYAFVRQLTGAANAGGPSSISATVPAAGCAQGNLVVIGVIVGDSASAPTMSDTRGNTWTLSGSAATNADATRPSHTYIYYSRLTTALQSGDLVTATISVSRLAIAGMEFSGVTASTLVDQTNQAGGSGTSLSAGSITTTGTADILVTVLASLGLNSPTTMTAGTGWTAGATSGSGVGAPGTYVALALEYRLETSAGSFTGDGTSNAVGGQWTAAITSFKEPAVASATGNFFRLFKA